VTSEGMHVINDLDTRDVGLTDHFLITCRLSITFCQRSDVVQLLRRALIIAVSELLSLLRVSSLFVPLTGSVSVDSYCADLRSVIVTSLDKVAPIVCSTQCLRKSSKIVLSMEGQRAKVIEHRRKLEKIQMKSNRKTDIKAYHKDCRRAMVLKNESRNEHIGKVLREANTDMCHQWRAVNAILHLVHTQHPVHYFMFLMK